MPGQTFICIDGHTCGNPVRLVLTGHPPLAGSTQNERRLHFMAEYDWIRTGLMFEPRGHNQMSGAFLYPPTRDDCDVAVLYIETSGCLPMCGHGTIGVVTMAIERSLVWPRTPGVLRLDTPAGLVVAEYRQNGPFVEAVKLTNVPSFLYTTGLQVELPRLGPLRVDVAYGGNFYPIVEPQEHYRDLAEFSALELIMLGRELRARLNEKHRFIHPEDPRIEGLRHCLWTGRPTVEGARARNAVLYGEGAIDRSPCGTGTSARMAQLHARGELRLGERFVHESIIGSTFVGRVEAETMVGDRPAIVPSIEGWARITGDNTITLDPRDPFWRGFQVV